MWGLATLDVPRNDFAACTGCSLCLLVCPVWRTSTDVRLTPHGRAKALQHGAAVLDITESIESCTMCGACEPVCPENIDLIGMIVGLRRQLPKPSAPRPYEPVPREVHSWRNGGSRGGAGRPITDPILLAGRPLRDHPATLARAVALLGLCVGDDDGADISFALEAGSLISARRLEAFLAPLRRRQRLIVANGLLLRHLRSWLPRARIASLGAALSNHPAVRRSLRHTDLYVIEPRAYHADYERQVRHYDSLRSETGCAMNLDLQRIVIPGTARGLSQFCGRAAPDDTEHARWILHGRRVSRIVVESLDDIVAFEQVSDCPVIHLAHVTDDARTAEGPRC